jgi:ankyrin repeat protein
LANNCSADIKDKSEMIRWFLENGLKLETKSPLLLPLTSIIQKEKDTESQEEFIRIARMMIQYGANVNALNEHQDCALMATLHERGKFSLRFAKFLIENGADCNLQRARGSILANLCLLNPDEEFDLEKIALLVENGADVNWMGKVTKYGYYEITDINPIRALFIEENKRSYDNMIKIIEYLVAHGGDLNMLDANGLNLIGWYNMQTGCYLNHTRNKRVLQYFFQP